MRNKPRRFSYLSNNLIDRSIIIQQLIERDKEYHHQINKQGRIPNDTALGKFVYLAYCNIRKFTLHPFSIYLQLILGK